MNSLADLFQSSVLFQQYANELRSFSKRSRNSLYGWVLFSLTTSLVIWGIWAGLEALAVYRDDRRKQARKFTVMGKPLNEDLIVPKFSPMVVSLLLETDIMPYLVIDVRPASDSAMYQLPLAMRKQSVNLPISSLPNALGSSKVWQDLFPFVPYPFNHDILLFVGTTENLMKYGATIANNLGYQRVAMLEGSIQQYVDQIQGSHGIKKLNRDVLSVLTDILQKTWPDCNESEDEEPEDITGYSDTERLSYFTYDYGLERTNSYSPQNSAYSKTPRD